MNSLLLFLLFLLLLFLKGQFVVIRYLDWNGKSQSGNPHFFPTVSSAEKELQILTLSG